MSLAAQLPPYRVMSRKGGIRVRLVARSAGDSATSGISGPVRAAAPVAGRLGVADAGDRAVGAGEAGHAAQGALAAARVVPQPASLGRSAGHPNGQLMADAHRFVPARLLGR